MGGRNVSQNPKTFRFARVRVIETFHRIQKCSVLPVGAHLCVRPPRLGVPVGTRADTQVRPYGRPKCFEKSKNVSFRRTDGRNVI